ncbi:DNA topoisomerase [Spiroplasma endosymbiont of Labia minor]|uniref:DNA topoisomerase n=1 Tax=Spiroplasma endosymbiont of Labia minor TaxID=3066305 RepID=UPI0030D26DA8
MNAIKQEEIKKQVNKLTEIDSNYVNAGLSRSYLDKTTGFILSKILQDQTVGISAGRVQSSVLKLLCDREKDIKNFVKEEWYILKSNLGDVDFKNVEYIDEKYEVKKYKSLNDALQIKNQLGANYIVKDIVKKEFKDKAFINFTTSDYLQSAKTKLKLKVKQATEIAQSLFEKGLITYIRTDSTKLDEETERQLLNYVSLKFGQENVTDKISTRKEKDTDQEGHPPITPTHFEWEPYNIQNHVTDVLTSNEISVYKMIWQNTINSAIKVPNGFKTNYVLENNSYLFNGETKEYEYLGYFLFDKTLDVNVKQIMNWNLHDNVQLPSVQAILQNTNPKSRFNEATLIKELERLGIGRPSTYKTSVEVNLKRNYVEIDKKDAMYVTALGFKVSNFLEQNFSDFINLEFTKHMEETLDDIAKDKIDHKVYIKNYFNSLKNKGEKYMVDQIKCPKCQTGYIRQVKNKEGKDLGFKSCSNWPNCDYNDKPQVDINTLPKCENCDGRIQTIEYTNKDGIKVSFKKCTTENCKWVPGAIQKCTLCNEGWLINRTGKKGAFIACNNYPKCKFVG